MTEPIVCAQCGRFREPASDSALALTWVSEREEDDVRWLCPQCARSHVRDIEGKLPREYW
jgi:hypothetical protein